MENNLYSKIATLVERKYQLKRIGGIIKHDKTKREEFEMYAKEYTKIEDTLDYIIKNCYISPMMVADIISVKEDGPYKLKIFRETDVKENHVYYTGRFVACYLNPSNKYYDYAENGKSYKNNLGLPTETYTNYAITKENFAELALSIPTTKSYVIATSSEQTFVPILPPSDYLEVVNFTKLFVYGYVDNFVSDSFQKTIKPEIKQYLETIDADKFLSESTTLNSDAVSE